MTGKTQVLTIRLEHDLVTKLDKLAAELSRPGVKTTRIDALRVAIVVGLTAFEGDRSKRRG